MKNKLILSVIAAGLLQCSLPVIAQQNAMQSNPPAKTAQPSGEMSHDSMAKGSMEKKMDKKMTKKSKKNEMKKDSMAKKDAMSKGTMEKTPQ